MAEFVRRSWRYIFDHLRQLSTNERLFIGALVVILVLVLSNVLLWSGNSKFVAISSFAADQSEAQAVLQQRGFDVKVVDGQLRVKRDRHLDAIAALQNANLMVADSSAAFAEMMNSPVWEPHGKFMEKSRLALQRYLANIIRRMKDGKVTMAEVAFQVPQRRGGLGASYVRPTAMVVVATKDRGFEDKSFAESIASLVSGAVLEMTPQDVNVVINDKTVRIPEPGSYNASETLAIQRQIETHHRQIIEDHFGYIRGVRVAVGVVLNPVGNGTDKQYTYAVDDQLASQEDSFKERTNQSNQGEAGARPNTSGTITGGGVSGTTETEEVARLEFSEKPMTREVVTPTVGQTARQVNVAVSVPKSHFESLSPPAAAGGGAGATGGNAAPAALDPQLVSDQKKEIEDQVKLLIKTVDAEGQLTEGEIKVAMYDDGPMLADQAKAMMGVGGVSGLMQSPWMGYAGIGLFSVLAMGIMLHMVRKAQQQPPMPTAEELAGVPPMLETDDDLVGEAEESEPAMVGLEVDEGEIRSRKVADQINEMVKTNPEEAARLFGKWVDTEI